MKRNFKIWLALL